MRDFLPFVVAGLATGSVYGLSGLGLVLTYKTSGVFNFGYGAVAALAALIFYALRVEHGVPWPVAAAVVLVVFAPAAGAALELMARSLHAAGEQSKVVATVGLILIVQAVSSLRYPANAPTFPHFLPQATVRLAGVNITWEQIIVFAFSAASSGMLYWFFRSVRAGVVMRGLVDSPDLVAMNGISPLLVRRSAWLIGTVFASLAGLMLAPGLPMDGVSLTTVVFAAFGAAALGFFTNLPLTFVGGLLIGVVGALIDKYTGTVAWVGGIPASLPFILLFAVLVVTPRARLASRRLAPPASVRRPYRAPAPARLGAGTVAVALLAIVPVIQAGYLVLWSAALVGIILFLSLGLLVRNSGQISLCHVAFAAVGAAAFGHFAALGIPWLAALLLASLAAVPVGALIAVPAVRVSGVFLALATLGFGILVQGVFYTRSFMFGATSVGLAEPRPNVSLGAWNLATDTGFYYLLLLITVLVVLAVTALTGGRLGRLLRAMADSQLALESRGASSGVSKVIVFCIAAAMASGAGALIGMTYQFAVGSYFPPFDSLTMVVLVVVVTGGDPWYAVVAAVARSIVPGYAHGSTVNSVLTLLFGLAAVTVAFGSRLGGLPAPVRALLDRTAWHRRRPAAAGTAPAAAQQPARRLAAAGPGLETRDLSVAFGGVKAVNGVSLTVPMGAITGLIGPNGAGKSTTFNACGGLNRPSSGQVRLHGLDVSRFSPPRRARRGLGRTFQRPELFNGLTVRQNVAMGREASLAGGSPLTQAAGSPAANRLVAAATDEALALTGITTLADRQVGLLTIGQRRLVELATVFAGPFDLLLLDEPSSGLDGQETEQFGRLLRDAAATRGVGILLVEHDMALVRAVCDRVYVLDFGSLIFEGTVEEMEQSDLVRAAYLGEASPVAAGAASQGPLDDTRPRAVAGE
ncbi:ATP-binding cassette domain-containing protein [Pseudofrankia sp. DC12]|uniref:ABC transporter permease subunit n=1 Tax=Pseudofrankia sp. DC12 TaxID=683315 RepID=UPI0005F83C72|nr:ATP-binding cassette domain-containing protein [Pseudofrankia sp. DC12]